MPFWSISGDGDDVVASIAEQAPETSRPSTASSGPASQARIPRWASIAIWSTGALVPFALLLRISLRGLLNSDGATNALQAFDMLHGNLLLHNWTLDDATYYTFELPLFVLTEAVRGLHTMDIHVVGALTYLIVVGFAVTLARRGSSGMAAVTRCAVALAVLTVPLIMALGVALLVEIPNHIGTSVFLLGTFLLVDRAPNRWFTAPLITVILAAGQLGDVTVRYIAVPAIVVVCGYRLLASRKPLGNPAVPLGDDSVVALMLSGEQRGDDAAVELASADAAIGLAAIGSVPLEILVRAAIVHLGGFAMIAPRADLAPAGLWPTHAGRAVVATAGLYGFAGFPAQTLAFVASCFGLVCVAAAIFGLTRVIWTWRIASRADQLLAVAIVIFIAVYTVSTYGAQRELLPVLPCGAVLAARACVPARIAATRWARTALATAVVAVLLPLGIAAVRPPVPPEVAPLTTWLHARGLSYGIGPFWIASSISVQSSDAVRVPPVTAPWQLFPFAAPTRATKYSWYNASAHDATFLIAGYAPARANVAVAIRYFGRPQARYAIAGYEVLIYRRNLLVPVADQTLAERAFGANPHVHSKGGGRRQRRANLRPKL